METLQTREQTRGIPSTVGSSLQLDLGERNVIDVECQLKIPRWQLGKSWIARSELPK